MRFVRSILAATIAIVPYALVAIAQDQTSARSQAASPGNTTSAKPGAVGLPRKGVAHVGCTYVLYETASATIENCYPHRYPELRAHLAKWLPIISAYWDDNVIGSAHKSDRASVEKGIADFKRFMPPDFCERSKSLLDTLSKEVVHQPAQADARVAELLRDTDVAGRPYPCL